MFTRAYFYSIALGWLTQLNLNCQLVNSYTRTFKSVVYGDLLKKFDDYCATNELKESEGVRECFRFYLTYIKSPLPVVVGAESKMPDVENKKFKRELQSVFYGKLLMDFIYIVENFHIRKSDLIREAIRIKVTHGKRN